MGAAVCAAVILGATSLILQLSLWNQPATEDGPHFYAAIPGADLRAVAPDRLPALLKRLNTQPCQSCRERIQAARREIAAEPKAR